MFLLDLCKHYYLNSHLVPTNQQLSCVNNGQKGKLRPTLTHHEGIFNKGLPNLSLTRLIGMECINKNYLFWEKSYYSIKERKEALVSKAAEYFLKVFMSS